MNELSQSPQLFEALLSAATDAIVISDATGSILEANRAAHEIFGYEAGGLVGRSVSALMPEDMSRQHDAFMSNYLRTGQARIIGIGRELEGLRGDGSRFPLHLAIGHTSVDGQDLFVAILHDLTTRRKVEAALERSQRMEALGQLTGGVAHDFNNLLTIITGNLELLEGALTDAGMTEIVADALDAAQVGTALTGQLLSFARRGILMPDEVNANDAIEDMSTMLRRTLGTEIKLSTQLEPAIWPIMADPTQVHTAILNLAMNARAAMPHGGTLTIKTSNIRVDDAYIAQEIDISQGDYVRITVSDTGEGMSENTRKRAFEPFFTTKPGAQGTGLGLSLVYGFVRQSGGHVTLYSEVGQGSTFSLYFPRYVPEDGALPVHSAQSSAFGQTAIDGRAVLIVEDNPAILSLTKKRLEALGYTTVEARSADEALDVLSGGTEIAVLFSDIVMPGSMTGYELAQEVRRQYPDMGILLTTAYSGELLDQSGALQTGFEMLRKPYRQEELARALGRITGGVRPSFPRP